MQVVCDFVVGMVYFVYQLFDFVEYVVYEMCEQIEFVVVVDWQLFVEIVFGDLLCDVLDCGDVVYLLYVEYVVVCDVGDQDYYVVDYEFVDCDVVDLDEM